MVEDEEWPANEEEKHQPEELMEAEKESLDQTHRVHQNIRVKD